MIARIIEILAKFIIDTISSSGYLGIVILMGIESACIPLPSEIIMPFSGYLVFRGDFELFRTGLAGAFGCVVGSVPAYYLGLYGGRPLVERYGKYVLISHRDLDLADRWFERNGDWAIFVTRLLPVVRTFISLPAGIARMHLVKFLVYTFNGSLIWCAALAYGGFLLGEHWEGLRAAMRPFDPLIVAVIIVLIGYYIYRHIRRARSNSSGKP